MVKRCEKEVLGGTVGKAGGGAMNKRVYCFPK